MSTVSLSSSLLRLDLMIMSLTSKPSLLPNHSDLAMNGQETSIIPLPGKDTKAQRDRYFLLPNAQI